MAWRLEQEKKRIGISVNKLECHSQFCGCAESVRCFFIVRPKAHNKQRVYWGGKMKWTTIECDVRMSRSDLARWTRERAHRIDQTDRFITKWQFYILMRSRVHRWAIDCDLHCCLFAQHRCCFVCSLARTNAVLFSLVSAVRCFHVCRFSYSIISAIENKFLGNIN